MRSNPYMRSGRHAYPPRVYYPLDLATYTLHSMTSLTSLQGTHLLNRSLILLLNSDFLLLLLSLLLQWVLLRSASYSSAALPT